MQAIDVVVSNASYVFVVSIPLEQLKDSINLVMLIWKLYNSS